MQERRMETRTRILFIAYIIIMLAIVAIGLVPYILKGDYKNFHPLESVSTIHVIDTNSLTKSVRFQIPADGVFFEEQNDRLYEIMKDKKGCDIKLSYQKLSKNSKVFYNFRQSVEIE